MCGAHLLSGVSLISSADSTVAGDTCFGLVRAGPVGIPTEDFVHRSSEGAPHLLVPQAVDERVEHGGHHGVEDGGCFPLIFCVPGKGMEIQESCRAVEEGNGHEVGGAGGEGFVPALRRADAPDGEQDAGVGDNDGQD